MNLQRYPKRSAAWYRDYITQARETERQIEIDRESKAKMGSSLPPVVASSESSNADDVRVPSVGRTETGGFPIIHRTTHSFSMFAFLWKLIANKSQKEDTNPNVLGGLL